MQAQYGCTMFACRQGYECDTKTRSCKPSKEHPALPSPSEPPRAADACARSADGLVSLCAATASSGRFEIHAQNLGPGPVVLSLGELIAKAALPCGLPAAVDAVPAPPTPPEESLAKPLGLRFIATRGASPSEPRAALFLSPGPPVEIEVVFEAGSPRECALDLTATFVVAHSVLGVATTIPAVAPE